MKQAKRTETPGRPAAGREQKKGGSLPEAADSVGCNLFARDQPPILPNSWVMEAITR